MADAKSNKSNAIFSAIVATVGASRDRRLTVRELAIRIGESEAVTAQCIALHRYLRAHADEAAPAEVLGWPWPADFIVPTAEELIDETALGLGDLRIGGEPPRYETP